MGCNAPGPGLGLGHCDPQFQLRVKLHGPQVLSPAHGLQCPRPRPRPGAGQSQLFFSANISGHPSVIETEIALQEQWVGYFKSEFGASFEVLPPGISLTPCQVKLAAPTQDKLKVRARMLPSRQARQAAGTQ